MHSISEIGTNVPAFLGKLWKMVEDPVTNDLISWSSTGTSFVIKDEIRFARELLPMYYKHNNMASFIRQLNMYGFHKMVSPDAGSMKLESSEEIQFTHPFFMRGHPYLLDSIKRKIGVSKNVSAGEGGGEGEKAPQVINKVLADVRQMKGRQESLDSRLAAMKLENGALWRELSLLRQKHLKQQQIVNKLIQFLVTIVQQNHSSFTVKRKYPRMLQHHHHHHHSSKIRKHDEDHHPSSAANSPTGPIIHELDADCAEALLETVVEEAQAVTPTDEHDYFLNASHPVAEEQVEEMELNEEARETIVGLSEDMMIPNIGKYLQEKPNNHAYLSIPNKPKKITEQRRPKYIKINPKKTKKIVQNQQDLLQSYTRVSKNPNVRRSRQQVARNQQGNKSQQRLQKNEVSQNMANISPNMKDLSQVTQTPIITIPFDSGNSGNVSLEAGSYLAGNSGDFNLPVLVVDVPTMGGGSPAVQVPMSPSVQMPISPSVPVPASPALQPPVSPAVPAVVSMPASPQDFLISSPHMMNDPIMTPRCEPVSTPVPTPASEPENNEMQVACVEDSSQIPSSPSFLTRSAMLNEMDSHVDNVQSELDTLRELLRGEGVSLDANTLLGYFNDDPMSFNLPGAENVDDPQRSKENSGNELTAYNPSLFDLADLIGNDWNVPTSEDNLPTEDAFGDINTPQFSPTSPLFPVSSKKRRK